LNCFLSFNQQIVLACLTALDAAQLPEPAFTDLDVAEQNHGGGNYGGGYGGGHHGGGDHHGWGRNKRRSVEEIQSIAVPELAAVDIALPI
jgi:hypothetical protein